MAGTSAAYRPDTTFHSKTNSEKAFVEAELARRLPLARVRAADARRTLEQKRKQNLAAKK